MIELVKEEEHVKLVIKDKPDFIPLNVFKKIKTGDGENICTEDILKFLVRYEIALSEEEVNEYLMNRKLKCLEMGFSSFCSLFSLTNQTSIVHSNKKPLPRSSKVK
mmetsp:Transcript_35237/g.26281  ORF Transcript_35237/g.26281 Transcript_35237/m.26281 type:complete len:106 (-) Transcript_35237:372-689(-)